MRHGLFTLLLSLICFMGTSQTADFTFQSDDGVFCAPVNVRFTQTCTGNPTAYHWDFGNSVQDTSANPSYTYTVPGTYNVKLTATFPQGTLSVTKTIVVVPGFTVTISSSKTAICKPPVLINFTAAGGPGVISYSWNFGDGSPVITTTTGTTSHNFLNYGNFNVIVKAKVASGCIARDSVLISVQRPQISGDVYPTEGCIPANSLFNTYVNTLPGDYVTGFTWHFNDGSNDSVTVANTLYHTYNAAGSFLPSVDIITSDGCTNSYNFRTIAFGTPPQNAILYLKKDTICASDNVAAVSKAANANAYAWDFGDGTFFSVSDTIVYHRYRSLGNKTISTTSFFNGCPGPSLSRNVFVTGTIAAFTYKNNCADKSSFNFINQTQGNVTGNKWDFGDGSATGTTMNPTHRYTAPGIYNVKLDSEDSVSHCSDHYEMAVYVSAPVLTNPDSVVCRQKLTTFTVQNQVVRPSATFAWHLLDSTYAPGGNTSFTITALGLGSYNNYVIIDNGPEYCPDTVRQSRLFRVGGPRLSFTMADRICMGYPLQTSNTSQPFFAVDSLRLVYWNFGEINTNDTVFQPQPYYYGSSGSRNVKVWATDKNGCSDSLSKPVEVLSSPLVDILSSGSDTVCLGQSRRLIALHSDAIRWVPASLVNCATCDTVTVFPTANTRIMAIATNQIGCTGTDSVLLQVFRPFKATASFYDTSICTNKSAQLLLSLQNKKVQWTPSAGLSATNIYNPVASPTVSTTYKAVLSDSVGCFADTVQISVGVYPYPAVSAGPDATYAYGAVFQLHANV